MSIRKCFPCWDGSSPTSVLRKSAESLPAPPTRPSLYSISVVKRAEPWFSALCVTLGGKPVALLRLPPSHQYLSPGLCRLRLPQKEMCWACDTTGTRDIMGCVPCTGALSTFACWSWGLLSSDLSRTVNTILFHICKNNFLFAQAHINWRIYLSP